MQPAFVECDGYQCGYCTSGQIMSAVALLEEPCGPADADVREAMSGNLCRCGAYRNIVAAIQHVRRQKSCEDGAAMEIFQLHARTTCATPSRPVPNRRRHSKARSVRFLAGGTTLLDLMKLNVERPGG